jgi:hypothetical protein
MMFYETDREVIAALEKQIKELRAKLKEAQAIIKEVTLFHVCGPGLDKLTSDYCMKEDL